MVKAFKAKPFATNKPLVLEPFILTTSKSKVLQHFCAVLFPFHPSELDARMNWPMRLPDAAGCCAIFWAMN